MKTKLMTLLYDICIQQSRHPPHRVFRCHLNRPQNGDLGNFYDMRLGMWIASRGRIGIAKKPEGKRTF